MLHPSAYIAYAAWLAPFLLPFVFATAWRERVRRKAAFITVGVLCGFGVILLSAIPLGLLLGWLNGLLGLTLRGPVYGGVPALIWFNGISMLAFNITTSALALSALARLLAGKAGASASSIRTGASRGEA